MPKAFTLRGVPTSLLQDGWWLACSAPADTGRNNGSNAARGSRLTGASPNVPLGLIVLIILGDLLFWGYDPGLSLSIFAAAVFIAALLVRAPDRSPIVPALVLLLTALPVIEYVQFLSVCILLAGTLVSVALLRVEQGAEVAAILTAIRELAHSFPFAAVRLLVLQFVRIKKTKQHNEGSSWKAARRKYLRNWAFPVGGTLVLCTLLIQANPVLEHSLSHAFQFDLDLVNLMLRLLLWLGLATMVVPFLILPDPRPARDFSGAAKPIRLGLNPGSVLRSLILFNLVLGVQTAIDMSILVGGAKLPSGMSLATYAHRGAYPLLAAAMLAGGFALAARTFLAEHRALKPLVLLWLAQNMLLGLTSALRLDFYVESFGLTYLRLHAMIWMGLVVVGLAMTGWQILRAHSNGWLLVRTTILGIGTLYLCSFVNFAGIIAATNLNHKRNVDWSYLCSLGPTATKSISAHVQDHPNMTFPDSLNPCWTLPATPPNWREWGFRNWRMRGYGPETYGNKATRNENTAG